MDEFINYFDQTKKKIHFVCSFNYKPMPQAFIIFIVKKRNGKKMFDTTIRYGKKINPEIFSMRQRTINAKEKYEWEKRKKLKLSS